MHKSRKARGMNLDAPRRHASNGACLVVGCAEPGRIIQGRCPAHYRLASRDGTIGRVYRPTRGWRGRVNGGGYQEVPHPDRPGMVLEHRLVMEMALGRPLMEWETVHHKNTRRRDNNLSNLELWVKPQPTGCRAEDLAAWVVEHYRTLVEAELKSSKRDEKRGQLRVIVA